MPTASWTLDGSTDPDLETVDLGPREAPAITPGPHWIAARGLCRNLAEGIASSAHDRGVTVEVSLAVADAAVIGFAPLLLEALESLASDVLGELCAGDRLTLRAFRDPYVTIECFGTRRDGASGPTAHQPRGDHAAAGAAHTAARATIEAHRGHVWMRSQETGETCVIVELPAAGPSERHRPWRRR